MRILVSLLVLAAGCMQSDGLSTLAQSEVNISNLSRICLGMDESEVLRIMHCPYCEDYVQLKDDQYDVWFYITNPTAMAQTRMVHFNLTPLTFKNEILVGTGWNYYRWLKEQEKMPAAAPPKLKETEEEKPLEKVLETSMAEEIQKPEEEKQVDMTEDDEEMIQEESDQNFNFW